MELTPRMLSDTMMRAAEHAELVRNTQAAVEEIRATAESEDGMVRVTASGPGQVLDIELDPRIYRTPDSTGLAQSIMSTIQDAVGKAEQDAVKACAKLLPDLDADADAFDVKFGPALHELDELAAGNGLDRLFDEKNR